MHNNVSAHEGKEPLVRIVRRRTIPPVTAWLIRLSAILLALVTGGLLIFALGHDPILVYKEMAVGSLGGKTALVETIKIAIPLLIAALSVALEYWCRGTDPHGRYRRHLFCTLLVRCSARLGPAVHHGPSGRVGWSDLGRYTRPI